MKKPCEEPGHTVLTVLRLGALLHLLAFLLIVGVVAAVIAVLVHFLG
ncbi:MAG TPA: hypothetical protein IAC15_08435 [Candidatus Onthomonas avicola]|nr:hypothetical protein [Candidatus Onthomonas avicola]